MVYVNKLTILLKLGAIAGAGMLVAFVLKFVLKLRNHTPENRVEISKTDEPELWKLILAICEETGAPKPKAIYLDPDVNAYVRYTNNLLSLIVPVGKELTIGMPLFYGLNQSEFKAVMSHEFGHFAQRSMRIGSYIGTSNTIIHGMIFSHDSWDRLMIQWRQSDIRIAVFGWILSGLVYILKFILRSFYYLLNVLQGSLSREMEFNADKFAVSTSGSIPIISGLWRLEPLSETWNKWLHTAYHAKSKEIYTTNLFSYLERDCVLNQSALEEDETALPDDQRGGKLYFQTSEIFKGHMYDSHPPNDQRESSAKSPFIEAEISKLSPSAFLIQSEKWQQRLTRLVYDQYWSVRLGKEINEAGFQQFIAEEEEVNGVLKSYQNNFADRYLFIPESDDLIKRAKDEFDSPETLFKRLRLDLSPLMNQVKKIDEQLQHAQHIYHGTAKVNRLEVGDRTFNKKNIGEAYKALVEEKEKHFEKEFGPWDRSLCNALAVSAIRNGQLDELIDRFNQHKCIVTALRTSVGLKQFCINQFEELRRIQEIDITDITRFQRNVNAQIPEFNKALDELSKNKFCVLPTIESSEEMIKLIVKKQQLTLLSTKPFEDGSFDSLMNTIEEALVQLNRIEQRSLASILKFENKI